jgi:hypothetical protein
LIEKSFKLNICIVFIIWERKGGIACTMIIFRLTGPRFLAAGTIIVYFVLIIGV